MQKRLPEELCGSCRVVPFLHSVSHKAPMSPVCTKIEEIEDVLEPSPDDTLTTHKLYVCESIVLCESENVT